MYKLRVSVGQEFGSSLTVWFWLRVSHEVAAKLSSSIWRFTRLICFCDGSLKWPLAGCLGPSLVVGRGLSPLPGRSLHRATSAASWHGRGRDEKEQSGAFSEFTIPPAPPLSVTEIKHILSKCNFTFWQCGSNPGQGISWIRGEQPALNCSS